MAKTRRKKKRTHVVEEPDPAKKKEPRTFVIRRGKHANPLADLEMDVRKMMQPNTAMNLKESRRNVLKDFVQVAGPLGVSHFVIFTATEKASYMRIAKTPRGPTMTMKIHGYSLSRDVLGAQIRPRMPPTAFMSSPLVVLNGFSGQEHLKLATSLFQGMFPSLNVQKVKLSSCQRVVLLARDKETGRFSLRHFTISVTPSGIRKNLKALLTKRDVPDLGNYADVSEFLTKSGYGSESEGEDAEASRVTLAHDMGKGNAAGHTSRVRLHEIGPRLELELYKIEEGMCEGKVLYHAYQARTPEEAAALQADHEAKAQQKESRRRNQEENVKKKEQLKKMKEEAAAAEKARAASKAAAAATAARAEAKKRRAEDGPEPQDDDVDYFKEEVGAAPEDTDMISKGRSSSGGFRSGGGGRGRGGAGGRGRGGARDGGRGGGRGRSGGGRGGGGRGGGGRGGRGSGPPSHKRQRR